MVAPAHRERITAVSSQLAAVPRRDAFLLISSLWLVLIIPDESLLYKGFFANFLVEYSSFLL